VNERALRDVTFDFRAARAVMAAVSLGVVERLAAEPAGDKEIARDCALDPRGAGALLAALAALGVVEREGESYRLSAPARRVLVGTGDRSRRSIVLHDLWHWGLWAHLEGSLRSGAPADRRADPFFSDPAILVAFLPNLAQAMLETSRDASERLARELLLEGRERVLDLGGGAGNFAAALARAHPALDIDVVDLPPVAREASRALARQGLAERIAVRGENFLEAPLDPRGGGYDLVLLSRVLMGLSDADASRLLLRVRDALRPGGRALLHEFRRGEGAAERVAALLDLDMLLLTGGELRSQAKLAALLEAAGLDAVSVRPFGPLGVLAEGRR
jgi:SAM-dependent methyltransferase